MNMFCNQCEQAAKGTGCEAAGVCGKSPTTSGLQDIIVHLLKGIGILADGARRLGAGENEAINRYTVEALFTTVTNVNFDDTRLEQWIAGGVEARELAEKHYRQAAADASVKVDEALVERAVSFVPEKTIEGLAAQAAAVSLIHDSPDQDIRSLRHILLFGLKGMAAYADHAWLLGREDREIFAFFHEALAALADNDQTADGLTSLVLRCGTVNIRCMEILDEAHTGHFGHPEPTEVPTGRKKGPAIVITGHDLLDLEELLKQTEGRGVNIYTHGEMLPAHGYPALKKYRHLAGHFGTAWQNQQKEFDGVPAAFLFTTNCIQKPRESYRGNVFTAGLVGWPGVAHVNGRDFSAVIDRAIALGGFPADEAGNTLLTGCARNAVLSVADKVVEAVKSGAIRRFFLVGGCDGAKPGRNYYTELAETIPKDCVILTLACGKFRFNDIDFGTIGGIPRLLDVGQCNDAYSAIKIAQALAGAFSCGVNDLPLSLVLSWYEQKAVVILLSLFSLGIKGIRLGPTLPAFITPNVLKVLVDAFDIKPIATVKEDLAAMLG